MSFTIRVDLSKPSPDVASFCVELEAVSNPYAVSDTASLSSFTTFAAFLLLPAKTPITCLAFCMASNRAVAFPIDPDIKSQPLLAALNTVAPTKVDFTLSAKLSALLCAPLRPLLYSLSSSPSLTLIVPSAPDAIFQPPRFLIWPEVLLLFLAVFFPFLVLCLQAGGNTFLGAVRESSLLL